jgi:O-antigen/teichoic acid export membrane protein
MSVRKAVLWSFGGQFASFAATFATTVVLARILSPREVGVYAIGLAITGVLQAISAFGIGTYIVREQALEPGHLRTGFTLNALISALLAGAILLSSSLEAVTMGEPMVARILHVLAVLPLVSIFEFTPATMLQREMRFRELSMISVARTVASAGVSIAAALLGASSMSAAYGGLAYAAVGVIGFNLLAPHHAVARPSLRGWRDMVGFGLQTLAIGGVSVLSVRLSDIVLGRLLGLSALGFYSRASALSNMLFQNLYGSAARVLLAKLADDARDGRALRGSYLHALDCILALMWPVLAGLAVLAGPAIAILFGAKWLAAAPALAILMGVQILGLSFAMHHELFVLRHRVGEQVRWEVVRSLLGLAAFAYGCRYGLAGAAAGRLVEAAIGMLAFLPRLPGLAGVHGGELARLYLRNALVSAAAIGPGVLLMSATDWNPGVGPLRVAGAVAGGGLLWLATLAMLRHPLYRELQRALASRRSPVGE